MKSKMFRTPKLLLVTAVVFLVLSLPRALLAQADLQNEKLRPWGGLIPTFDGDEIESASEIVILLHGYGASPSNMDGIVRRLRAPRRSFVLLAGPIVLSENRFAWATNADEFEKARAVLKSTLNYAANRYPSAVVCLGGFSQGASLASTVLLDDASKARKLLLYSPGVFFNPATIRPNSEVQVLISHGRADEKMPFSDSEDLRKALDAASVRIRWLPFEGGHTVPDEAIVETKAFLLSND